jgi:hypothetical protein
MSKGSRRHCSDGERRRRQGDDIYKNRSFMNDKHTRQAEDPSGLDEEQGMGDVPAIRQAWHSKRQKGAFLNHQTDMASFQVQLSIKSDGPENGEMRRCQGDVINKDRSKVNDESMRRSRGMSAVDKKQATGNKPDPQLPTRSRTRETSHNGLQMASPASQKKPSVKLKGPRDGETRQHHGDDVYDRCRMTTDGAREKLTNSSVCRQEWSTDKYSQVKKPKAPDKHVRRIEDRSSLVTEESRGDHNGTGVRKCSYTNIEPPVSNDENSRLSEKVVNG